MQPVTNRKLQILEVATRLFSSDGYDRVTVKQIADQCHITEPAIYRHYKSKEAIFGAVLTSLESRMDTQAVFDQLDGASDIEVILRGLAEHILTFHTEHTDLYRLLLYSVLRGHDRAREVFDVLRGTYVKFLYRQLTRLYKEGAIVKKNNQITARCFIGMVFDCAASMTLWRRMQGKTYDSRDVIDNNVPIYSRGLKSDQMRTEDS